MLMDRGCSHVERRDVDFDSNEIEPCLIGTGIHTFHVFFHNEDRVGVKMLRHLIENTAADTNIVVSTEGPTTFTRKEAEGSNVQFFLFKDLSVNITRHKIVPKHELVIGEIPWSVDELPRIPVSDPVVMYYNFKPGSVVKISRVLGAHEPQVYYRLVVKNNV